MSIPIFTGIIPTDIIFSCDTPVGQYKMSSSSQPPQADYDPWKLLNTATDERMQQELGSIYQRQEQHARYAQQRQRQEQEEQWHRQQQSVKSGK